MNACSLLHDVIENACPNIHKKRLVTLQLAVKTLCFNPQASLSALGRAWLSPVDTKHCIKRMDRLLGNTRLHAERVSVYRAVLPLLIARQQRPVLIVDWSQINEEAGFHILRASLASQGRALTVYEEVHPQRLSHNRRVHGAFLRQLKAMMPEGVTPILVTDAGFKNPWFRQVEAQGWYWMGRIRHTTLFRAHDQDGWRACRSLNDFASETPQSLGDITLTKSNPIRCAAYLYKKALQGRKKTTQGKRKSQRKNSTAYGQREREPWFLVTNLPGLSAKQAVKMYRTRMQIEESFRDSKNQRIGLSLKESRSRNEERLQILLLIVALATLTLWLIGSLARQRGREKGYQANTEKRKAVLSTFNLGMQVLRKEGMPETERETLLALMAAIPVIIEEIYQEDRF
ncbi:IS4 family transposase [Brenneria tiliae]|uniref:IS4 family transposase n=1 Tax=Brenneria tiliae TaxID=2914984 RepID=UPI0020149F3B|nr:IS4 family transposase [Brenneria tiliae]MCL2895858.1 IS4 family transposase [Brenneria tiliae]MCL2900398.1 IS4 family transposase [Brenneria tiliae]